MKKLVDFTTSKFLAGIGSLLLFLGFLSTTIFTHIITFHGLFFFIITGHILSVSGMILGFIGMKGLAEHYRVAEIYKKTRTSVFLGITNFILLTTWPLMMSLFEYWVLTILLHNRPGGWIYTNVMPSLMFAIGFAFMILTALTFRKALNILTIQSGKHIFRIAGIILLIGTILAFMYCTGFAIDTTLSVVLQNWQSFFSRLPEFPPLILVWVAFLILAIAFFSLYETRTHNHAITPYNQIRQCKFYSINLMKQSFH
jgi:uncharacterized membrane protein